MHPLNLHGFAEMHGMRHNGHRWVEVRNLDTIRAVIPAPAGDDLDMFGGSGQRRPPHPDTPCLRQTSAVL